MTREQLEHIIRASAAITNQYDIMIFGSQAILGADPNPAAVFTASMVESRPEFGLTARSLLARIRRWAKDAAVE
ncbi:hypothetical protein ACFJIX_27515 [Roseateles sp. UC29_93]|uniref:hypothetical protein n=1 Tax=Roseateles sp. UC29_93 TaxID=3350177 RepID=UPI00366C99F8